MSNERREAAWEIARNWVGRGDNGRRYDALMKRAAREIAESERDGSEEGKLLYQAVTNELAAIRQNRD